MFGMFLSFLDSITKDLADGLCVVDTMGGNLCRGVVHWIRSAGLLIAVR